MTWAHPLWLLLLPALAWLTARGGARPASFGYPAIGPALGVTFTDNWRSRLERGLIVLRWVALALIVIALARPQWGVQSTQITREGIAIAMVVDISSSMGAEDLKIDDRIGNRLAVVKQTFARFVEGDTKTLGGRDGDLIGLYTFARYTDALSPLTLDHRALLTLVEQIHKVALPEEDGTAIGDAMMAGLDGLREVDDNAKVLILLTDGSNNAGDIAPLQAAQAAKALGVKVYTIGT